MVSDRHGSLSSSCLSLVGLTMEKLKSLGQYEDNAEVTILVGRKKEVPEGIDPDKFILIGDCLKMHRSKGIFVEGCPPGEPPPHWAIVDRCFPIFDLRDPGAGPALRQRMNHETPPFIEHRHRLKVLWNKEQTLEKEGKDEVRLQEHIMLTKDDKELPTLFTVKEYWNAGFKSNRILY